MDTRTPVAVFRAVQVNVPKMASLKGEFRPEGTDILIPTRLHQGVVAKGYVVNTYYYGNLKPGERDVVCDVAVFEKSTESHGIVRLVDFTRCAPFTAPTGRLTIVPAPLADDDFEVASGCYLHLGAPRVEGNHLYTCGCGVEFLSPIQLDPATHGTPQCPGCRDKASQQLASSIMLDGVRIDRSRTMRRGPRR